MEDTLEAKTTTRLFIGIPIPEDARKNLQGAVRHYSHYVEETAPDDQWSLALHFLGNLENYEDYLKGLTLDMPQSFLTTISITHVGRGINRRHLWAYAHETKVLDSLRQQVRKRLDKWEVPRVKEPGRLLSHKEYIPHIKLAKLLPATLGVAIADVPMQTTFVARELNIYRRELSENDSKYAVVGKIRLVD